METKSSVAKRKKRKTRKCLDELRKRSRRNDSEQSPIANMGPKQINLIGIKPNVCITSDRLTLAMFPKLIKSETITRPIISEIRDEPVLNFGSLLKNNTNTTSADPSNGYKVDETSHSDSDYIKYSDDKSISSTYEHISATGQISLQKDSDSGNLSNQDNSPGSFLLFSPAGQREDSDLYDISPESLSTTSASSQSYQFSCGYQLYEEFMSEIPLYLRQNTPALIKDDVMKKTKSLLHNMYLDSCRRENEENILQCMRKKKGYTPKSPKAPASAIRSPVIEYLHLNHVSERHAEPANLYDTPEYTYYPHKLNQ